MPNRTIFLIDDDSEEHIIFKEVLQKVDESSVLLTSLDCEEAIMQMRDPYIVPDIIFLDLNLPGMTGFDCLKELKKIDHLKEVPIVIYTTSTRPEDEQVSNKLGASYFISKPSSFSTSCTMLELIFEKFLGNTPKLRTI
jgi:CheY-like chemotaxis protein